MRIYISKLCNRETKIAIGKGSLDILKDVEGEAVIIHSRKIDPRNVAEKLDNVARVIGVEDGERAKDIENVLEIIRLIHRTASPDLEWIVAVGGGTVLDVAGFAASIYRRGVKLINIPTTLLGMVDAAMGGKNGVNFDGVKNVLGTFYQPNLVISETSFLATLPLEEILNGLAEVVKYCITLDRELCFLLESRSKEILSLDENMIEEIIYRSAVNKMKIVEIDERDNMGIRIVLNYGHTIGHAIEAGSGFRVPHGKAISVGMVCEALLAEKMGMIGGKVIEFLINILRIYRLPTSARELGVDIDMERAVEALRRDKKRRRGSIRLPLLTGVGMWRGVEVKVEDLEVCLKSCLE
ncbi:MAG: 3-dehydroquinate synthase [Sulfolobales archaeon]